MAYRNRLWKPAVMSLSSATSELSSKRWTEHQRQFDARTLRIQVELMRFWRAHELLMDLIDSPTGNARHV